MNDDRLISLNAAIDALGEEPPVWYDGEDEIAERNQWRRDVAAIKALPSAQQWISCSERLPEDGRVVLWCNEHGSVFTTAITARFDNSWAVGKRHRSSRMVAWMLFPEPWKGERDG